MAGLMIPPYGPSMGGRPQVPLAPAGQPNPSDLMGLGQVFQRLRTPGSQPMPMPQVPPQLPPQGVPPMPPQLPIPPQPGGPMGVPPVGMPMAGVPGGMPGGVPALGGGLPPFDMMEMQQQVTGELQKPMVAALSPQDRIFRASANLSRYRPAGRRGL